MVSNLVSNVECPLRVPCHPLGDTVYVPDPRLGNVTCQLDGFIIAGGCGLLCTLDGVGLFIAPLLRNKGKKM